MVVEPLATSLHRDGFIIVAVQHSNRQRNSFGTEGLYCLRRGMRISQRSWAASLKWPTDRRVTVCRLRGTQFPCVREPGGTRHIDYLILRTAFKLGGPVKSTRGFGLDSSWVTHYYLPYRCGCLAIGKWVTGCNVQSFSGFQSSKPLPPIVVTSFGDSPPHWT